MKRRLPPILDAHQRVNDRAARRLGVETQRELVQTDRAVASRTGHRKSDPIDVTLGPFYVNDVPGSATTQATLGFFNTATAVSRNGTDPKLMTPGEVIGAIVASDDARTAGSATVKVRINGTALDFADGAVALNAAQTATRSQFVPEGKGVPFNAGDAIGASVVSSGWTPTTANLAVWLMCRLKAL